MKPFKYIAVSLSFLFAFVNNSFAQYASIEKDYVVRERVYKKEEVLISECFGETINIKKYNSDNNFYITFVDGNLINNSIYNLLLDKKLKLTLNIPGQNEIIYWYDFPLSNLGIDPQSNAIYAFYIYENNIIPNNSLLEVNFYESLPNCSTGDLICGSEFSLNNLGGTSSENSNLYNVLDFNCSITTPYIMCPFNEHIIGEQIGNNLEISTENITNADFNNMLTESGITNLKLKVTGHNGQVNSTRWVDVYDIQNGAFEIEDWNSIIEDFNYLEYYYRIVVEFANGSRINCPDNNFLSLKSKTICNPLSLLKYKKTGQLNNNLNFSFDDISNNLSFEQLLNSKFEMSIEEVESIIANIDSINFKLFYSENNITKEKSITKTQLQLEDIENLNFTFEGIDFSNFTGVLKTTVYKLNNVIEYCDDKNIIFETLPEPDLNIPSNNCDPNAANAANLSQTLYSGSISVGDVFTANNFPIVITKITTGTNTTGIYGGAIVPLPFQGKQVLMDLVGVKFNVDRKMIAGSAEGVKDTFDLGLNNLPLNIGGDICLPPPPPAGYTAGGINSVNGLNKYGFNPETGLFWNGSQYDPGGFDVNGIHKDSGLPYNNDGCTRDGVHFETGVKCDPYGGTPEELPAFIDSIMNADIDTKLRYVIDSLITKNQNAKPDCSTLRNSLLNSTLTDAYTVCNNNELAAEGLSTKFEKPPIILPSNLASRDATILAYETNHVNLYKCDLDVTKINKIIDDLNNLKSDLTELKVFIEEELSKVKKAEFEIIKKDPAFKAWLGYKIGVFLELQNGGGFIKYKNQYFPFEPSQDYNALASNNFISSNENKTYSKEHILKEIAWLYNSDQEIINNVPRGYYSQALVNTMEVNTPPSIPNVLPLPFTIEKANNIYIVYIERLTLYPESSLIDVTAVFKDKKDGTTLAFGGINIPIFSGGVNTATSKIYLKNDVSIKLLNTVKLNLKKGTNETFVTWNCDGIDQFKISGSVEFCSNYIIPLNPDLETVPNDSIYKFDFTSTFKDWLDFTVKVKGQPFYIKGAKKFPIVVDSLAIDFSKALSVSANVPIGYSHTFYDESTQNFDPLWKGVSLHDLQIHLPKNLVGSNGNEHMVVGVEDAVFDDTGFSGIVYGEDLINIDTGSLAKWDFSIDGISVLFLHNNIAGGGIRGEIGVSFLKHPLRYDGILTGGNLFKLQVKVDSVNEAPAFFGKVVLKKNSCINVNIDFESDTASIAANLTGSLVISADTGKLSKLLIPSIKFENFIVASYEPYFDAGKWGIDGLNIGSGATVKPNFSLFGVSIDSIYPHKEGYVDEIYLGIAFKADLIDSFLSANGRIDVVGKMGYDNHGRQKWRYNRTRLGQLCINATVKKSFTLDACVEFFEGNTTFGKGFRGAGKVTFGSIESAQAIQAVCQFGTVEGGHKYFFVDVMYVSTSIAQIGPITLTGLGGGVSKGMYPQFQEGVFPQVNFDPQTYLTTPLGTTMSGVVYQPNPLWGWEFKLLTKFKLADDKMLSGFGEFIVRLNNTGALEEIELRATAVMFSDLNLNVNELASSILPDGIDSLALGKYAKPENIGIPTDDITANAIVKGFVSVKINFIKKEFHGQLALFMNGPGISGAGPNGALVMAEAYFAPKKWYIYMGKPTEGQRCGIKIDALGALNAKIETYLTIGTEVPGFPGLPKNVAHLAKEININESMRKSGLGFAFGASFDVSINLDFYIAEATLNAGLGFDVMLKKYKDVSCLGSDEPLGANGWYSMGQMWAYITGSLEVAGINIAEAGAAAVLQAQFPNPTWVRGIVELYVNIVGIKGTYTADFEIGSPCTFTSSNPGNLLGIDLFNGTNTESNSAVDQFFRPQATFIIPLNKGLDSVQLSNGVFDFTFALNLDSTKIYYGNGTGIIDAKLLYNPYNLMDVIIIPSQTLPANDSIIVNFKVDIFKEEEYFGSQSKTLKLYIGPRALIIPKENVEYTYPVDGMYNFYKNENKNNFGFIKLVSGQGYIFNNKDKYLYKAKFTKSGGGYFYSDSLTYNYAEKLLKFDIDPSKIDNNGFYKLEIIASDVPSSNLELYNNDNFNNSTNGNNRSLSNNTTNGTKENILYTLYFRSSMYNSFEEKMEDHINNFRNETNGSSRDLTEYNYQKIEFNVAENFDAVELKGKNKLLVVSPNLAISDNVNKMYTNVKPFGNPGIGVTISTGVQNPGNSKPFLKPIISDALVDADNYKNRKQNDAGTKVWGTFYSMLHNSNVDCAYNNLQFMADDYFNNYGQEDPSDYFGNELFPLFEIKYMNMQQIWSKKSGSFNMIIRYTLPDGTETYFNDQLNMQNISYTTYISLPGISTY